MVRRILISLAMIPLAAPAVGAPVDSSELARCHAMATRDQQLDCYEALAAAAASGPASSLTAPNAPGLAANASGPAAPTSGPAATASGAAAPTSGAAPMAANQGAPTAPGLAAPMPRVPAAPTASAVPSASGAAPGPGAQPPAPFNPDDPANWGLSRHQADPHPSAPSGPTSIKTTVFQMTEDRLHNVTVLLDNGQTWKFIEPDPRLRPGDSVTIKRASLGSFLMLTPSRRSYRVERSR